MNMTSKAMLVQDYNEHMLTWASDFIGGGEKVKAYPDSLIPFFTDNVELYEAETLPWGGTWKGREGFLGEALAFIAVFGPDYSITVQSDRFWEATDTVFHEFVIDLTHSETGRTYRWSGMERYLFDGDRCSELDVFYKDTAGLLDFLKIPSKK
jgi:hypothetical protein